MMVQQNRVVELDDTQTGTATTEEFLAQIHRSTALMSENRSEEAKQILEVAFQSRQHDPSSQATLALVYFKLGIYPRALSIYENLVKSFPEEPTLRLNLGLVYLKTGQTDASIRELETAVRISPNYRKANGYLGLAYQRKGDYYGAKRAFERAGAHHLAERMVRYLPRETSTPPDELSSRPVDSVTPRTITEDEAQNISRELAAFEDELPLLSTSRQPDAKEQMPPSEALPIGAFAAATAIREPEQGPYLITESGYLMMTVENRSCARFDGLHFLTAEQIVYTPLYRRYRGKISDEILGGTADPMFEITGKGRIAFHPGDGIFNALMLSSESVFLREDFFFAKTPGLTYENGRIPASDGKLVHLNGHGAFVLKTPRPVNTLPVTPERGMIVPGGDLVGWFGRLLPKPAEKSPFNSALGAIELTGEGVVLFCLP